MTLKSTVVVEVQWSTCNITEALKILNLDSLACLKIPQQGRNI